MSTWTDVTNYIKTQLKPGVLGNTNVQKILNSVLAIVNQINAASIDPENNSLWDAETIYPADTVPVLWMDQWLVSNIADNEGNVPISTAGVVHPTWRVIGSSAGSGIRVWEPIVYPNALEIVFVSGSLYYLDRTEVGADPFVSVDFATELAAEQWKVLTVGSGSGLVNSIQEGTGIEVDASDPANPIAGLTAAILDAIAAGVVANGWGDHASAGYLTDLYPNFTPQSGTALAFDGPNKYGFNGVPLTGNLTFSVTGAKETVMIKACHNSGTAPTVTPPGGVTAVLEGGEYVVSVDNILYAICHKNDAGTVTKISYSWTQNQL